MTTLFVPDVPEFQPVWQHCIARPGMRVTRHAAGYIEIETSTTLELRRSELRIPLAVWFGLPTGGLEGRIAQYDKDVLRLEPIGAGGQQ
ncbi:MAG: hypothetical protein AB7L76_24180 [Burkholderiaceae bacterium]